LLAEHPIGATPATHALCALLCLHAARLPGRLDDGGNLLSLRDHDRTRWDRLLIEEGQRRLEGSAAGSHLTRYHLEAAIAWQHATARRFEDTDWEAIAALYDAIMRLAPSPIVGLNRAIAIGQRDGASAGIAAIDAIADGERLERYPFYHAALAEFLLEASRTGRAIERFRRALSLARTNEERAYLQRRLDACGTHSAAIVL
jgi:RNA polymerase sigma-70 factor (ECF subfamily)